MTELGLHFRIEPARDLLDHAPPCQRDIPSEFKRRWSTARVSPRATVIATTLILIAISLLTASEVRAAQAWIFTINGTVPIPVTVASNGSFQFPLVGPFPNCPKVNVTVKGVMTDRVTINGGGAGCDGNQIAFPPDTSAGTLSPQPFPNATSFSSAPIPIASDFTVTLSGTNTSQTPQVAQATAAVAQAATLGSVALATTSVQTSNIGLRLAALRRGAAGVSLSGLSLNVDGKSVPLGAAAGLIPGLERSGGASADRSSILSRLGIFATGQGSFGSEDATSKEPGYDYHTTGITLGVDYRFTDQFLLGMAFGYLRTKAAYDSSAGDSAANGYNLSAYGTYYILDRLYVDGIVTGGWNTYNSERNIPDATAIANSNTNGTQFSVSVSTGYNFNVGAFGFGPTGRVNYVQVHIDGYQESGASLFNVAVADQNIQSVTTAFGGQATYVISMPWGVLTPLVRFEWEHEYEGNSRTVTGNLVANPSTTVVAQTNNPDRDYFNLGAGVSTTFQRGVSAFLQFDTVLGRSNFSNYAFNTGVRFEF